MAANRIMPDGGGTFIGPGNQSATSLANLCVPRPRIFIIEGALTAFIGLLSPLIVVDWPHQCRFLSQEEKDLVQARLLDDSGDFRMDTLDSFGVKRIILDWKIWLGYVTSSVAFGCSGQAY